MESLLSQFHDLILCITTALETRDPHTSLHSARVAEMTEALCDYMGINAHDKETYHIAAHLHDIGKIGIPDRVLLKADTLTGEEWALMRAHSEKGWQILVHVHGFELVAAIVRSHHERWDGKGYPDGLKGLSIPEGSRIIAVADSIDAMLTDRPYRRGMTHADCRAEIEKGAGIMYDPEAAQAALAHWDELLERRESCAGAYECSLNPVKTVREGF